MTGSQQDQERLKEWAMEYFEENMAAYIVEEGWDGVLEGDEEREVELIMDLNEGVYFENCPISARINIWKMQNRLSVTYAFILM